MTLQGKNAVVTGGSTGIGQAIALAIAQNGGQVALVARNQRGLQDTMQLIKSAGGRSSIFQTDLRDQQAINKLHRDVQQSMGKVDIVVNVAGVWHNENAVYYGPNLADTPAEQVLEVLEVGIVAPMMLTRLFLPDMIENGGGKVLNISGTFSSGGTGWLHYYVSKKAIEAFTVGLADDLRVDEIQVNCICPSDVATPALKKFFPGDAGTALQSEDVASLAMFLLSKEADNITGQIIVAKNKAAHKPKKK
jgi:3-oxoacyl-[acyl-carrier protein] reductase